MAESLKTQAQYPDLKKEFEMLRVELKQELEKLKKDLTIRLILCII